MILTLSIYLFAFALGLWIGNSMQLKEYERLNLNDLAKEITLLEGKKRSISIAQVKEVMTLVFQKFSSLSEAQQNYIVRKYAKK